mmetsp:Transcript_53080/g.124352  ORF Transcript_53080/g.124352 Transcript_53080/m.124352 type:complete len:126 (+) Transcript_53080:988-1365(+)
MTELTPCLEADNAGKAFCNKFTDEVQDIKRFHELLFAFSAGSLPASALFVAFHDMVTESIPVSVNTGRRHFYCWREAVSKLKKSLAKDGQSYAVPEVDDSTNALFDGVLGLGRHDIRVCHSGAGD